jgi:hypothetical protein
MPQVISASRRTDIPGFFSEWFLNRLKAGYVYVQQPYSGKMNRVSLRPGDISAVFFCSKNYAPLLNRLEVLEKTTRNLFFHFTITSNRELEFHTPDYREAIKDYIHIARRYSPDHIIWRYDPICITDKLSFETHLERFVRCAELLNGHATRCIISFAHPYKKALANFRKYTTHTLEDVAPGLKREYAARLSGEAEKFGIELYACCSDELVSEKIQKARCVDGKYLSRLFQTAIDARPAATRKECRCTRSVDIGAYDTCAHGCVYCYANMDKERACRIQQEHDPGWNSLRTNVNEDSFSGNEPLQSSLQF